MRSIPRLALAGLVAAVIGASGCGRLAVRASEKEYLADPVMVFDQDPQTSAADDHVLTNREGQAGGNGASGGGCGCN
ncbi:MAG: DUF4266 domain-containing protein [Deltaproteobacteria bacterium]|nr:DUF4266 domain-containing protein [Deltaproteobacteria bacterium]